MRIRAVGDWSLARRILLLQAVILVVVIGAALAALLWDTDAETERQTGERVTAVATTVAAAPTVVSAVTATYPAGQEISAPSAALQPYAEQVRRQTRADFVVIMRPDGIRYTHPDLTQIGQPYRGSRDVALAGGVGVETYTGTLGPSRRAIAPVLDDSGEIVALVSVGITVDHVDDATNRRLLVLAAIAVGALLLGIAGAMLISRWVRRQTLGMGTRELARMFTYYDAVLASVHEGMLLLDRDGRIVSVNAEGRRLLGVDERILGSTAAGAGFPAHLAQLVDDPSPLTDELVLTDDRVLVLTRRPVIVQGAAVGAVVTLRDHTEIEALTGELDRAQRFSDALRAQAHESANRMHTVISLIELGEAGHALTFAVGELATAQTLADGVVDGVGNPAVAAILLAKSAQAAERGIEFAVTPGSVLPPDVAPDHELVTILGNLLDNAFDAVAPVVDRQRRVEVGSALTTALGGEEGARMDVANNDSAAPEEGGSPGDGVRIVVSDTGPGLTAEQARSAFTAGWSTKQARGPAGNRGLGLALVAQAVGRCGGTVHVEPGQGARFVVWLPLPTAPSPDGGATRDKERSAGATRGGSDQQPVGGRPG